MVKVQDEEPRSNQSRRNNHGPSKVPAAGTSNVATQHFHYHWSYPTGNPAATPATFHFGPGFEPQTSPQQHVVYFHVNPGVTVSFQMGENVQVIKGPVTVPMVSTNSSPPIAMPVQVPHGHVVQQIVDENGTLRHVILSPQHPPMVPMPTHYGPGPASGSSQGPQAFFTPQSLPPVYPPFGHGTTLQPGMLGHVSSTQPGHSPPPTHNFHKDERTQRQYIKLKKKLEQKQMRGEVFGHGSPPISPKKDLSNGVRGRKGMSSVGTSEDGEESSSLQDEDDDSSIVIDILSNIKAPQVSELTSRSALILWSPPDCKSNPDLEIHESALSYEVLLSDKGKEGKYKSIYVGTSLSCRIQDLRPGTEYCVCVTAWLEGVAGTASEPTILRTPSCEPDIPSKPKLITRTRTSLQLRWPSTYDNGSPIIQYVLECDNSQGEWKEVYKGKGKQCNMSKLQPATCFRFRLYAVNEYGKSDYSEEVVYWTNDSPPSQPLAPVLQEAGLTTLSLSWERRPTDDEFTLQMDDKDTGHGFLPVYNGRDTSYVCTGLRRYTCYKFRLRAVNNEGASQWSEEISFKTLPARPGPPIRLSTKGRVHAHAFKVKWDPPSDKGGSEITGYILQLKINGEFTTVYSGVDCENVIDRLNPGTQYELRVSCESAGGKSDFSDVFIVTTEAVCPGQCASPRLHGKPRPYSLALKWSYPDFDGGSPITECELLVKGKSTERNENEDEDKVLTRTAYKGKDLECVVNALLPGQNYSFILRASNRVGYGPWSDPLEVCSGSAPPEPPEAPSINIKSNHTIGCTWNEPATNGAPIIDYRLELALNSMEEFNTIAYQGPNRSCDVKSVPPATLCHFRLQASNISGWSDYSSITSLVSPCGVPGAVHAPRYQASPTSIQVSWNPPPDNGDPIIHYCVEVADKSVVVEDTSYEISGLSPHTSYKVRIRAVNNVGQGPFSSALRAATLALPPSPPTLSCCNIGHNYLKLKWGEGKNPNFTQYTLQMENSRIPESFLQTIYHGPSYSYKVNKLLEQTTYRFCISACNDAGQGPNSKMYEFRTGIAPPPSLKAPRTCDIGHRSCTIEWQPSRFVGNDLVTYSVQLSRLKDQEYKQVYRGSETKTSLNELEVGAEYSVRVCPIRQTEGIEVSGAFSPATTFSTIAVPEQNTPTHAVKTHHTASSRKPLSDQQYAMIILGVFALAAILLAVIMQHFIY